MRRALLFAVPAALLLSTVLLAGEKVYVAPKVFHANTYPARDDHPMEHVSIAADPYDMPDKTAGVLRVPYKEEGLLPIRLVVSNDSNSTVVLTTMHVELVTVKNVKIEPSTPDDIYRRISNQSRPDKPRIPLPIPRKPKSSVSREAQDEVENSRFLAQAVEPHTTKAGFLYFDVEGISHPLAGAHLYITGVRDANGQELMYFDISLEKYLGYQPGH